jgi:hypothetical protein
MQKIKALLIVLLCIVAIKAHAQNVDCKKFKTGKFQVSYDGIIDTVTRSGFVQADLVNNLKKYTYDVKWVDDCTFTLTPTAATLQKDPKFDPNPVTVSISKTTKTGYTQTISKKSGEFITMDVVKIK